MNRSTRILVAAAVAVAVAVLAPAALAASRTWYVAPSGSDSGCAANSSTTPFATVEAAIACARNGDVITLAPSGSTPYPGVGPVGKNVTIQAAAFADARTVAVDLGQPTDSAGLMSVGPGHSVRVQGVALGCPGTCNGSLVTNNGTLTLTSVVVTGAQHGAAINDVSTGSTPAVLTVVSSTIAHNSNDGLFGDSSAAGISASRSGGAPAPVVTVQNSTLADNSASFGTSAGAIAALGGAAGEVTLVNDTIVGNSGPGTGGIGAGVAPSAPVLASNTIVAGNTSDGGPYDGPDCIGTIGDGPDGHNLVGDVTNCNGVANGVHGDLVGVPNPGLNALADNGGSADTLSLQPQSPAIGAGDAATCQGRPVSGKDERGVARKQAKRGCDIGAYDTAGGGGTAGHTWYVAPGGTASDCASNSHANAFATVQAAVACASGRPRLRALRGQRLPRRGGAPPRAERRGVEALRVAPRRPARPHRPALGAGAAGAAGDGGRRSARAARPAQPVASLSEPELYAALREAVEHQVLVVDGDAYAFRHALLRDAIYDDMLPGEGIRLHAGYAAALAGAGEIRHEGAAPAGELAHHLYAAHDVSGALPVLLEAARQAAAAYAHAEAQRHLERALEVWSRVPEAARQAAAAYAHAEAQRHLERALEVWSRVPDAEERTGLDHVGLLERAARAAIDAANEERGVQLLDRALAEIDPSAEPGRTAMLLDQKALTVRLMGRASGIEELEEGLALLPAEPSRERAVVLASLAVTLALHARFEHMLPLARDAVDVAQAVGARREEASGRVALGQALAYLGEIDEGLDEVGESLRLALETGDSDRALRAYIALSDLYAAAARHEEAIDVAREGVALARQVGLARTRGAFLMGNEAESLFRLGRWQEAERVIDEAVAADTYGLHGGTLSLLHAEILVARERYSEAEERARTAAREVGDSSEAQYGLPLATVRAAAARGLGQLEQAAEIVSRGAERFDVAAMPRYGWPLVWTGVRIAADRAEQARDEQRPPPEDDASALVEQARALATRQPEDEAYCALVAAEAARLGGEPALEPWSEALTACRSAGDPALVAYALLRVGDVALAGADRAAAADALREADAIAGRLGAAALQNHANALARRARINLSDAAAETAADGREQTIARLGVTARELDVLRLVAAGRSNGQIAAELFISPKTASVHVSNILGKLSVSTRVQAAAVAHRLGLFDDEEKGAA
jgi:DNA-binding CsgD family transcriptional regulator/tetratricopeptide (TPR) repeat protein